MQTKLIYMENMHQYTCVATVAEIRKENGITTIILNQTVFYPQGGGQPYDTGIISNDHGVFTVTEVRYEDGAVYHSGTFEIGEFTIGETVTCKIDIEKRKIHTRLHSAGHLLDIAIKELNLTWKPGKGYHFPQGPYVEYSGSIHKDELETTAQSIEAKCKEIILRNTETRIEFSETNTRGGKPLRIVYYSDVGVPCGGTHVTNLREIDKMVIRKIKQDKGVIRVSYA